MTEYQAISGSEVIGRSGAIKLQGPKASTACARAGRAAAEVLDALVPHVVPGVTTQAIDDIVYREMIARAAASRRPSAIAASPAAAAPRSTMSSATAFRATGR